MSRSKSSPHLSLVTPVRAEPRPVSHRSAPPSPRLRPQHSHDREHSRVTTKQRGHKSPISVAGCPGQLRSSAVSSPSRCHSERKRDPLAHSLLSPLPASPTPSSPSCYVVPPSGPLLPTPELSLQQLRILSSPPRSPRLLPRNDGYGIVSPAVPFARAPLGEDAFINAPPGKLRDVVPLPLPHVPCSQAADQHVASTPPRNASVAQLQFPASPRLKHRTPATPQAPRTPPHPSSPSSPFLTPAPLNAAAIPFFPSVSSVASSVLAYVVQSLLLIHSSVVVDPSTSSLIFSSPDRKSVHILLPAH